MIPSFKDYYNRGADIALVPGSFKPPHKGHYEMVEHYSKIAKQVIVLISAPSAKSERRTKTGKVITPQASKAIFDIYTSNLPNVHVEISNIPSPVGAVYEALETLNGNTVILGASKKDDDWKRWTGAQPFIDKKGLNINLLDPQSTAVDVVNKPNGMPYSASNIRDNFDQPDLIAQDIPDHVNPETINGILSRL